MKVKVVILTFAFALAPILKSFSQTPVFSQYYASGLYLNPALAGLEKDTYLGINYRSQWSNLRLPFSTFQFSFILPITKPGARKKHLGGLGLSYYDDVAGANKEFTTQGISVAAAHNFHLNRHGNNIVAVAVQGGLSQQRVNYDGLKWSSQYSTIGGFDPLLLGEAGFVTYQVFRPIVNIGAMWYYTNKQKNLSHYSTSIYNGLTVSNIIRTNGYFANSKDKVSILYKAHGGFTSTWSRIVDFSPNYLIQVEDHNFQINLGMYVGYSIIDPRGVTHLGPTKLLVGVWYRLQDAFILSTGLSNAAWNIGFSYDSNIFAMSKTFGYGSAYELSMAYRIRNKNGFKRFSSPLI